MKYTIYSASQYTKVGTTDSAIEALKMARTYEIRNSTDDVTIEDETGKIFDKDAELEIFVDGLMEYPSDTLLPITVEEAEIDLAEHRKQGMDVPEQMTAEIFAFIWNQMLEDDADTANADKESEEKHMKFDSMNTEHLKTIHSDEYKLYMKALCWIASQYVSKIRVQFAEKAFEMYHDETVRKIVLAYGVEHDKLEASRLRDFQFVSEHTAYCEDSLEDSCLNNASHYAHTVKMLFGIGC